MIVWTLKISLSLMCFKCLYFTSINGLTNVYFLYLRWVSQMLTPKIFEPVNLTSWRCWFNTVFNLVLENNLLRDTMTSQINCKITAPRYVDKPWYLTDETNYRRIYPILWKKKIFPTVAVYASWFFTKVSVIYSRSKMMDVFV